MARRAKENTELAQMEEEKMLNELYTQIEADGGLSEGLDYNAILKLYEFKKAIADAIEEVGGVKPDNKAEAETFKKSITGIVAEVSKDATATNKEILAGKTAWVNGIKVTGTMANRGAVSQYLNAGGSYTIPAGYHNGSGRIIANSLASQTQATAAAGDIVLGKTAWVNGIKITGTKGSQQLSHITNIYNDGFTGQPTTYTFTNNYDLVYLFGHSLSFYNNSTWPAGITILTNASNTQIYEKVLRYDKSQDISRIWLLQNVRAGNVVTLYASIYGEIAVLAQ